MSLILKNGARVQQDEDDNIIFPETTKQPKKIILNRINKHVVTAIPLDKDDLRPVKGHEICKEAYSNIFLCARKKSGKTSALFKILKECSDKNTKIIVFCSTLYKDKNWIAIRKYFKKKGMDFQGYTDLFEDGVNNLDDLIEQLNDDAKAEEEKEEGNEDEVDPCDRLLRLLGADREEDYPEEPEKKSKYLAPEYIIVFDDLSHQLKHPTIVALLKKNRHYRCKIIVSSQWVHDMDPQELKQLDLWLVFKGLPESKLQKIAKDADISIPFPLFWKIYKQSTKKPYSFLYIDTTSQQFRKNFNTAIEFPDAIE